jgi:hypothetical protein
MISVDAYKTFVRDEVVPNELKNLDSCKTGPDVTAWRKAFNKALHSKLAEGEQVSIDVLFDP